MCNMYFKEIPTSHLRPWAFGNGLDFSSCPMRIGGGTEALPPHLTTSSPDRLLTCLALVEIPSRWPHLLKSGPYSQDFYHLNRIHASLLAFASQTLISNYLIKKAVLLSSRQGAVALFMPSPCLLSYPLDNTYPWTCGNPLLMPLTLSDSFMYKQVLCHYSIFLLKMTCLLLNCFSWFWWHLIQSFINLFCIYAVCGTVPGSGASFRGIKPGLWGAE